MIKPAQITADVGVIIGRFQVHELHEAHKNLINTVTKTHDRVIVFLGLSPVRNTINNPLDFNSRKRMFQEAYPEIEVHYIEDNRSDAMWSKNLDREIEKLLTPHQTVVLYGSRDSFIPFYEGKYSTIELDSPVMISGTEIRRQISNKYPNTKEFRAGMIAATFNRYPTAFTTVDVAVVDKSGHRILMGKKRDETALRFIGGFSTPNSPSFEADARREVMEEAGITVETLEYVGSYQIEDWRYRKEVDKIKTIFYIGYFMSGRPAAGDDLESIQWVDLNNINSITVVPEHEVLRNAFVKHWFKQVEEHKLSWS